MNTKSFLFLLLAFLYLTVNGVNSVAQVVNDTVGYKDSLAVDTLKSEEDSLFYSAGSFMNSPSQKKEDMKSIGFVEYLKSGINNTDPFVKFSYYLIIILFFLFVITFLFIILNRLVAEYFKRRKAEIIDEIEELIANYMSLNSEDSLEELEDVKNSLKKINKNSIAKRITLKYLLSIDNAFSGDSNTHIKNLYLFLDYHIAAKRKLKSESWSVRAKAIRELSQMDYTEATPEIRKSLNHINPVLRLEAGIALLKLDKENPFALLDVDRELTYWQQMNLLEIVRLNKFITPPLFSKWLHSKQETIIEFSIRLIEYFQQLEAKDELLKLLNHPKESIKIQVIKCLGRLDIEEAITDLVSLHQNETSKEVRIACISSIAQISSMDALDFLVSQLDNEDIDEVLTIAISLRDVGNMGVDLLKQSLEESNEGSVKYKAIIHALDENLKITR